MRKKKILETSRRKSYNSALERYKNKRRKEIGILISLASLVIALFVFFNSSFVKVKNINVEGLIQIEKNDLIETAGLSSELKIWKINAEEYEKKIHDKYNIVSSVKIEKKWLNGLEIQVKEKKLLAQEKKDNTYIKLLEDGQEYTGKVLQSTNLPVIENFSNYPKEKAEILKNLSELDLKVLYKISEITLDDENQKIATIYMRDGQRVRVNLVNFSSKLNYYNEIERFIEDKRSTVLNFVNGTYLETPQTEYQKNERVNTLLNSYFENQQQNDVTTTKIHS